MVQRLTTEDMQALGLKDAFSSKQKQEGAIAGSAIDLGMDFSDYLGRIFDANLLRNIGKGTIARGKQLDKSAGAGAAQRLANVTGQRTAAARDVMKKAATVAAQDPTGAGAVQLARDVQTTQQRAGDSSKELTAEMDVALKQKAFAEKIRALGEQQKLTAEQEKKKARLGLATDIFEGAGKLAQALEPPTYEAKLDAQQRRQGLKALRAQKKALKKFEAGDLEGAKKFKDRATEARDARSRLQQEQDAITIAEFKKLQAKAGAQEGSTEKVKKLLEGLNTPNGYSNLTPEQVAALGDSIGTTVVTDQPPKSPKSK